MDKTVLRGTIFDIQSFSVHDGPGCRTTIFMNGCPLRCTWCANPEGLQMKPQVMFSELACRALTGCNACQDKCTGGGMTFENGGIPILDWSFCRECTSFDCVKTCYNNAFRLCAREYTVEELMKVIRRDSNHWQDNGGVTFSGGDPLMQSDFLEAVLKACKQSRIHTAVETSGCVETETFLRILNLIDFAFIDVKHMDGERHKEQTGVSNDRILRNISELANSPWPGRLVLRMPVIGGYNDDWENIDAIIGFMHQNHLVEINLLPFHRMGESKWNQLGYDYAFSDGGDTSPEQLSAIQDRFLENDIACYVGSETPF